MKTINRYLQLMQARTCLYVCHVFLVLCVATPSDSLGLTQTPLSLPELVKRSSLIVRGVVIEQQVIQRQGRHRRPWIYTVSTVTVQECWHVAQGSCPHQVIVSQIGGTLPAQGAQKSPLTLSIPGMRLLKLNEEAGLFLTPKLDENIKGQFVIVGGSQGLKVQAPSRNLKQLSERVELIINDERARRARPNLKKQ